MMLLVFNRTAGVLIRDNTIVMLKDLRSNYLFLEGAALQNLCSVIVPCCTAIAAHNTAHQLLFIRRGYNGIVLFTIRVKRLKAS
jgi:hypothetical protein